MSSAGKQKQEPARPSLVSELFQFGLYKPNQGRIVRQVTFFDDCLFGGVDCLGDQAFAFDGWLGC